MKTENTTSKFDRVYRQELEDAMAYHKSGLLANLAAYNRSSMETAAFDQAAKHATIFTALSHIAWEMDKKRSKE